MKTSCAIVLTAAIAAASVSAHHGKEGFDDTPITLRGTVVDAVWQNPHVLITLEVKNADGKAKRWAIDGSPPNAMRRGGFMMDALKAGTVLTVTGFPTADRVRLTARSIAYPDGRIQTTSNEFFKPLDRTQTPAFTPAVR